MTAPDDIAFRRLFHNRDFAVLYATGTQSQLGDQLARVALSVLVFVQTGSGFLTASAYALTYLPAVVGGVLLARLADTRQRRGLLVTCDALRAVLFALMAVSGMPLVVVCVLLVLAVLAGTPYNAAEPAIVADMYSGARYQSAIGLRTATVQAAQLLGFAVGGVVVALTGARAALLIDAATFALSAAALRAFLGPFPAHAAHASSESGIGAGIRAVVGDARLRVLLGFAWLTAMWVVPEGLAAPFAAHHGGGPSTVGVLLAAGPTGNLVGTVLLTRWAPPDSRPRLLAVLALAAGLPMLLYVTDPAIPVAAVLLAATGLFSAYLVLVVTEFVDITPPAVRGRAIGLAGSSLLAAQGIGLVLGGALDALWGVSTAIAVAGALGAVLALPLALARHRLRAAAPEGANRACAPQAKAS